MTVTHFNKLLDCFLTRSEVAYMWGRRPNTITDNIYRGRIVARQTMGGGWLISYHSVVERWGQPTYELPYSNTSAGV